jgi:hypothetical protein
MGNLWHPRARLLSGMRYVIGVTSQVTRSWPPDHVCGRAPDSVKLGAEIGGFRAHDGRGIAKIGHLTLDQRSKGSNPSSPAKTTTSRAQRTLRIAGVPQRQQRLAPRAVPAHDAPLRPSHRGVKLQGLDRLPDDLVQARPAQNSARWLQRRLICSGRPSDPRGPTIGCLRRAQRPQTRPADEPDGRPDPDPDRRSSTRDLR